MKQNCRKPESAGVASRCGIELFICLNGDDQERPLASNAMTATLRFALTARANGGETQSAESQRTRAARAPRTRNQNAAGSNTCNEQERPRAEK